MVLQEWRQDGYVDACTILSQGLNTVNDQNVYTAHTYYVCAERKDNNILLPSDKDKWYLVFARTYLLTGAD